MGLKFAKQWGPKRLREWEQSVEDNIRKSRPKNGAGTMVDEGPDGMPINVVGAGEGGGGSTTIVNNPPFDPTSINESISTINSTLTTMQTTITALQGAVTTLQNRLNNATGSGTCTDEGIEINLSFPE